MIAKILLTFALLAISLVAFRRSSTIHSFSLAVAAMCICALFFVWQPSALSEIANIVGIGRGADLLLYAGLIFVLYELLIIRLKDQERMRLITQLARSIAISNAKIPDRSAAKSARE
ncbi:DUF2304 domain-containing protein [Achromobacter denitrificans]|uniref:DUF2304 domain-containing protein n=1 Tax=Achromobacter denitrificans TaxID=32002 RepID=UPI000F4E3F37|nr:DUF2304 domain-containing protein [Achromobacter denitrificans]